MGARWFRKRDAREELKSQLEAWRASAVLHAAARLGITDLLAAGPRSSRDLAEALGADEPSLRRLLRGLVVHGICTEEGDGRYGLTETGTWLLKDKPCSLRGQALLGAEAYRAWGSLPSSVMTGEAAYREAFGVDAWQHRRTEPELDAYRNEAFVKGAVRAGRELLAAYDFTAVGTVADIGGGYGSLLAVLLEGHPPLQGILFDQPHVVAGAAGHLEESGVADRCRVVGGDFLAEVPAGADLYLLKSVLHNWDDRRCRTILENCRRGMADRGRVLVVERVWTPEKSRDRNAVLLDLNMMAVTGGRERSAGEFDELFAAAGFSPVRRVELPSGFSVLEGEAAGRTAS